MKVELLCASVLLGLTSGPASSQQATSSNFVFPSGMGNTGVFRIPAEEGELQVQVELMAQGESRASVRRCDPVWSVRDPAVLALVRSDPHYGAWVKPVKEGITELRAVFSCAPKLNLAVPVVVGAAGIERPFAPTGEARNFYPATLEIHPPGSLSIAGGKAIVGLDEKSVQFSVTARSPSGSLIDARQFPVKWSVSNPSVLVIEKSYDHTAFFSAVGAGTATVTASIEGISQAFDITVGKEPRVVGRASTLATRTVRAPTASSPGGAAPTLINVPMGPVAATVPEGRFLTMPVLKFVGEGPTCLVPN